MVYREYNYHLGYITGCLGDLLGMKTTQLYTFPPIIIEKWDVSNSRYLSSIYLSTKQVELGKNKLTVEFWANAWQFRMTFLAQLFSKRSRKWLALTSQH